MSNNPNAAEVSAKREIAISGILSYINLDDMEAAKKVMGEDIAGKLDEFFRLNSLYRLSIVRFLVEGAHKAGVAEGKSQRRRKTKPETQEEETDATEPVAEPG